MSVQPEPVSDSDDEERSHDGGDDASITPEERQSLRQKEWGQQYDMWLIRAARRKSLIELCLSVPYPGVTRDEKLVSCVPIRVDKYMIQVLVDNVEIWLSKKWIVGCKPLGGKVKTSAGDGVEESPAE